MAVSQVGVISVRLNGNSVPLKGNVTYSLGGLVREELVGPVSLVGFKNLAAAPFVELETIDSEKVDLEALRNTQNATITTQLVNGKTIVLNDASVVGTIEVSGEDGGFTVRFVGGTAKEV